MGSYVNICVLFFFACHLLLIQTNCGYELKTFRCKNDQHEYIRNKAFCDDFKDCDYGEDESFGCRQYTCGAGKFACDNSSRCLNITARCNTIKNCDDGTDELNCGDEINVKNCASKDKFLCRDGLRCLNIEYTCDGSCNCFDCSDENENCSKTDYALLKRCVNAYFTTANGPQCFCDSNDDQNNITCKHIKKCSAYSSCEQQCTKYKNKAQCLCYEGYHLIKDTEGSCMSNDRYEDAILYATMFAIKLLNVTSKTTSIIQSGIQNCTILFAANNYVYYATLLPSNRGRIFKSPFVTGKSQRIIETDFPVTSVAVDYITNNVYFTSNGSLWVCENNGQICTTLKCCGIKYVAVAPKSGFMLYVQQANSMYSPGYALLMKSNMDGSDETIFADDAYMGDISIVIDESQTEFYLLEAIDDGDGSYTTTINLISFDGEMYETRKTTIVQSWGVCNGDIYFTVNGYDARKIFHRKKVPEFSDLYLSPDTAYFSDNYTSIVKFVYAYNSVLQRSNENPCAKASCFGLCLIKPAVEPSSGLSYTCLVNNPTSGSYNPSFSSNPDTATSAQAASVTESKLVLNCTILNNNSTSTRDNLLFTPGVVPFILVFVVLGTLGISGYIMFLKRNCYDYYVALLHRRRNKHDPEEVTSYQNDQFTNI